MSQFGLRSLIKATVISDQAVNSLSKRMEQYRKVNFGALEYFQIIVKNHESFQQSNDKFTVDFQRDLDQSKTKLPQYYSQYIQLYKNISDNHRVYSKDLIISINQSIPNCKKIIGDYCNLLSKLQGLIRVYRNHQQNLFQLSKKYFKGHKNMIANIEMYKNSFTDVKLIYNMDQKNRRYNNCEGSYKNLIDQIKVIEQKVGELTRDKNQIIQAYKVIKNEFNLTSKILGKIFIHLSKLFATKFCNFQNSIIIFFANSRNALQKLVFKSYVVTEGLAKEEDLFKVVIDRQKCQLIPIFLVYHREIREQCYPQLAKCLNNYLKEVSEKMEKRKAMNKKMLEFTSIYFKYFEKGYVMGLKDIISCFEKNKKRLAQVYGSYFCKFFKANNTVFEGSISIYDKMMKRFVSKLKGLQSFLGQQSKVFDTFMKQLKGCIDKIVKKKQLKRLFNEQKQVVETGEQPELSIDNLRLQVADKMEYIHRIVEGFHEKIRKNNEQIKIQFDDIVAQLAFISVELHSISLEYKQLYFGNTQFGFNYNNFQVEIESTLQKQGKFFEQTNLGTLLKEGQGKIAFEPQLNKIQEFRKLKKPIDIEIKNQNINNIDKLLRRKSLATDLNQQSQYSQTRRVTECLSVMDDNTRSRPQNLQKQQKFLLTKISFLQDEKFYKSFTCGLSDNIILQGRLFITNHRLCFYSKFNTTNVFFGETFIQIPRKDIKKVEKRTNAIVFDNSISITTVNGQVFLTSFFSRNQAYKLICQTMQISNDEVMFVPQQNVPEKEQAIDVVQRDDLKQQEIVARAQRIEQLLQKYQYKPLHQTQFIFQNLNALKFFKMFQLNTEFSYNRKTYKNFGYYLKDCFEHRDNDISEWSPDINEYLNSCIFFSYSANIKSTTPDKFTKQIHSLVPIPSSGVPFMPKEAKSYETVSLFLVSKDKYIIESTIQNSGVPYSETFNIKLQKTFETIGENRCRFSVLMFMNFNQSTMMKSIIESKSMEQSKTAMVCYEEEIKKYLRYLQKKRGKNAKDEGQQNKNSQDSDENSNENNMLRQQNQKLKKDTTQLTKLIRKYKCFMLVSLLVNLLLMYLLIY